MFYPQANEFLANFMVTAMCKLVEEKGQMDSANYMVIPCGEAVSVAQEHSLHENY